MSLNANLVSPPLSPQQQDSPLPAALPPSTPDVANPSEPTLSNRAAINSSVENIDEINQPLNPITEHSAPEKSDRSTSASLVATIATSDDEISSLKKAAEQGDAVAQYKLGVRYDKGDGVEKNKEEAFARFHKAAELGYANAMFNVGVMYGEGEGVEVNKEKAFMWFHKAAELGSAEGQFKLSMCYENGYGVEVNKETAAEWLHKAASLGNSDAQFTLGLKYDDGDGVEIDREKAITWYERAACQGHINAQANLGVMYYQGLDVGIDDVKAFKWFYKAAEQGDLDSQYRIAEMYASGEGVKADKEKAFALFQELADKGILDAQFTLGKMYSAGEGVKANKEKAVDWYRKAAGRGNLQAMKGLCKAYKEGQGVPKNILLATYWFVRASIGANRKEVLLSEKDIQWIEYIPDALKHFSDLEKVETIVFKNTDVKNISSIAKFIRSNSQIKCLIVTFDNGLSDDHIAPLSEALKSNTHLTKLVIYGDKHSKTIMNQIEILLTQNKDIAELRQYVLDHPLVSTVDIPTDVINILDEQIIVSFIKSGQTMEATKIAIDEFLIIASTTALAKDSKLN